MGFHVFLPSCSCETPDLQTIHFGDDTEGSEHPHHPSLGRSLLGKSPCVTSFPSHSRCPGPFCPGSFWDTFRLRPALRGLSGQSPSPGSCHQPAKHRCLLSLFSLICHAKTRRQALFCKGGKRGSRRLRLYNSGMRGRFGPRLTPEAAVTAGPHASPGSVQRDWTGATGCRDT